MQSIYIWKREPDRFNKVKSMDKMWEHARDKYMHINKHVLVLEGFENLLNALMHLFMTLLVNRPFQDPEQTQ